MKKLLAVILALMLLFCCACVSEPTETNTEAAQELQVYFIDVGQADCALIIQGESTMLVDGGNVSDAPEVISFIKKKNIKTLDVVVATHAHEDHIGGLSAVIDNFSVNKVYCPVNEYNSNVFEEFKDSANRKCGITLCRKGDTWNIGQSKINVVWPVNPEQEDTNNTSIVFTLKFGKVTYLFTGDAEKDVETKIVDSGADIRADVLKVGHHGSSTSTSYYFLRSILPYYAVISCGKDNKYGHPNQETLDIFEQAEASVFRTDEGGTVCISTDGENITVKQGDYSGGIYHQADTTPGLTEKAYIGNKNSKKFHLPDCSKVPGEENRVIIDSREEAINSGYSPCGICKP